MDLFDRTAQMKKQRPYLSKGEYVYHLLKEKIVSGYLERNITYTIVEIAENLSVSRTPVGEAVKILASQNYIILYPGVGFKVKEQTAKDIRETLLISGALEEVILRQIINDGTAPTEQLKEAVKRSWTAWKEQTPDLYTQASADFHTTLSEMSGLVRVTEMLNENVLAHEVWYRTGVIRYPEMIQRLIMDHDRIVEMIACREYILIPDVINKHVEHCEQILFKVIAD